MPTAPQQSHRGCIAVGMYFKVCGCILQKVLPGCVAVLAFKSVSKEAEATSSAMKPRLLDMGSSIFSLPILRPAVAAWPPQCGRRPMMSWRKLQSQLIGEIAGAPWRHEKRAKRQLHLLGFVTWAYLQQEGDGAGLPEGVRPRGRNSTVALALM